MLVICPVPLTACGSLRPPLQIPDHPVDHRLFDVASAVGTHRVVVVGVYVHIELLTGGCECTCHEVCVLDVDVVVAGAVGYQ